MSMRRCRSPACRSASGRGSSVPNGKSLAPIPNRGGPGYPAGCPRVMRRVRRIRSLSSWAFALVSQVRPAADVAAPGDGRQVVELLQQVVGRRGPASPPGQRSPNGSPRRTGPARPACRWPPDPRRNRVFDARRGHGPAPPRQLGRERRPAPQLIAGLTVRGVLQVIEVNRVDVVCRFRLMFHDRASLVQPFSVTRVYSTSRRNLGQREPAAIEEGGQA